MFHCNNHLYNPGNSFTNQLSTIISNLLTPNEAFSISWNLSLQKKKAIRLYLSFFFQGIATHKSYPSDKFLTRKLTEIIKIYLPRYDAGNHPLNILLSSPSLVDDTDLCCNVASTTLDTVEKLLREKISIPGIVINCLKFLETNVTTTPLPFLSDLLIKRILLVLLDILISTTDKNITNPIMALLKYILDSADMNETLTETLCDQLKTFVQLNLAFKTMSVFKSFKVIKVLNKNIIEKVNPYLSVEVDKLEKRRGSGKDTKLRQAFEQLSGP